MLYLYFPSYFIVFRHGYGLGWVKGSEIKVEGYNKTILVYIVVVIVQLPLALIWSVLLYPIPGSYNILSYILPVCYTPPPIPGGFPVDSWLIPGFPVIPPGIPGMARIPGRFPVIPDTFLTHS